MSSVGTSLQNFRKETDSLGEVQVPADKLWGAQTQPYPKDMVAFIRQHVYKPEYTAAATASKAASHS